MPPECCHTAQSGVPVSQQTTDVHQLVILAHLGGVDEIGIWLIPVVLVVFGLRWAEKRAKANAEEYDRLKAERPQDRASGADSA